ncbi:hypothetical protein OG275_38270 (plasmid) [Streptomyces niveus]|uniref:hypothetical protein n=1 Tax=Streptomyces niveus TaxID=193462 RepID=UPI002E2F719E|nr:hypothetical protein [Streptomyces niveus]
MTAMPNETQRAQAYANAYRVEEWEGPQSLAEMRAALAVLDPAELAAFNARHDVARFGLEAERVISDARRTLALRTRPEVLAAIAASLAGETTTAPVAELDAYLERRDSQQ